MTCAQLGWAITCIQCHCHQFSITITPTLSSSSSPSPSYSNASSWSWPEEHQCQANQQGKQVRCRRHQNQAQEPDFQILVFSHCFDIKNKISSIRARTWCQRSHYFGISFNYVCILYLQHKRTVGILNWHTGPKNQTEFNGSLMISGLWHHCDSYSIRMWKVKNSRGMIYHLM